MPWDLAAVKKKYPSLGDKEARQWMAVANSAMKKCEDEGGEQCDVKAIIQANGVVKKSKKQESLAEAAFILNEIGRTISTATGDKIQQAIGSMKAAIEVMTPLVSTSEDKIDEAIDLTEAAKILAQADSYDNLRYALSKAIRAKLFQSMASSEEDYYYMSYPYIRDMFDGYVVYSYDNKLYMCDYTVASDAVTIGDASEVKISYVPVGGNTSESKSLELKGDLVQLQEKAVNTEGRARVKIISPGWGSSGYYSAEMLKRDGPKVFTPGLHMYMNHPTEEEENSRPERNVLDLAGVIDSKVVWEDASPKNTGEGLYADVKVLPTYKEFIDEAAPYIGVSIRASGVAKEGEAEGKKGYIVQELQQGLSVDYVTMAGRGGEILPLYESARKKISADETIVIKETNGQIQIVEKEVVTVDISPEELTKLQETAKKVEALELQNSRLQETLILSEARTLLASTLAAITMPDITRNRLIETCLKTIPVKDNALDREKLVADAKEAATNELKYLESVTGTVTGGKVIGITNPEQNVELNENDLNSKLEAEWERFGLSESGSKIAVFGRIK